LLLGNFITASSVILRHNWFCELGGFDESLPVCEDWDMWLRFSALGGKAAVCREPLTRYRWHDANISKNHQRVYAERLKVLQRALESPRGRQVPARLARKALAECWRCSAWHAQATLRWKALQWYLRAAWYEPFNLDTYKQIIKCCIGRD
jgi:GT2 family glycosyltransferase